MCVILELPELIRLTGQQASDRGCRGVIVMKYDRLRQEMVTKQIEARGITDVAVLNAMRGVPRHLFVSEALMDQAYSDYPLPIGEQQTISQPYIVAEMTQALSVTADDRVLEIWNRFRIPSRYSGPDRFSCLYHRAYP